MKIDNVIQHIKAAQEDLVNHKVYKNINTIGDLKLFMEGHVFAVWDFMSLLKSLQKNLTCTKSPWLPVRNTEAARFINEIVLEEETDQIDSGKIVSHFELYLDSMEEIGADTRHIKNFINNLRNDTNHRSVINTYDIAEDIKSFLNFTFDTIESEDVHKIAASFTFGRENVIPDMFIEIVRGLNKENTGVANKFVYYLERHIELDGDDHGPIALKMIENLCGNDEKKWKDVMEVAENSIRMRIKLWDHINESITS
tara:strand:- start:204 stop:968 length:765 start_codon:yes stop_codon:yes gene_type:complete